MATVRAGELAGRGSNHSSRQAELDLAAAAPPTAPAETIIVTGSRMDEASVRAPTSSVTVIDTSQRNNEPDTVTEALAETVGVQVRRFGGLGAFSTISIRGSTSNQVRFYLDGIPLSRARNETVNLADFPLDSLARVEVYRGTVPVGFGAGGIAGVVNLVTEPPTTKPETELVASYGSYASRKVTASHGRQIGGFSLLGHITYVGSEGDFTFRGRDERAGAPAQALTLKTRQNGEFDSVEALVKAAYRLDDGLQLDLTSETFFKDQGVPGRDSPQARHTSLQESRSVNYLRATRSESSELPLALSATVFGIVEHARFTDPRGELGAGNVDRVDDISVIGGNTGGTYSPIPSHVLGWFGELLLDRFAGTNRLADEPDEPDQTRVDLTLALQHQAAFLDERLLIVPTIRYEHLHDRVSASFDLANQPFGPRTTRERDLWSPSLGALLSVQPWLAVRGNLGRFQRPPNFSELFGTRGIDQGNPDLHDEEGINRDVGFIATFDFVTWLHQARVEYTYFNNDYTDLIVFEAINPARVKPFNIGAARVRGHEVTLSAAALDHLRVDVNYTHQNAEDRGTYTGRQLPGRPAEEVYARLEGFAERAKLYYEFNFVGSNFVNRSNFDEVRSRTIHTVGATVKPRAWLSLNLEANNLTDDQVRDLGDFPLPGRSFFGTIKLTF